MNIGKMFGFPKEEHGETVIANRIFETQLYNLFLSEEVSEGLGYQVAALDKNQFIKDGMLENSSSWNSKSGAWKSTIKKENNSLQNILINII